MPRRKKRGKSEVAETRRRLAKHNEELRNEVRPLGEIQAARLASAIAMPASELVGKHVSELAESVGSILSPTLAGYQQICGRVVKTDPATGDVVGVPFATVHVEDTDCSFLGYFPSGWPWGWLFPFNCQRETLATVVTDECGRFCVWVPKWDLDAVRRWHVDRFCFPVPLRIIDFLEPLVEPPKIRWPWPPDPDPVPWLIRELPKIRERFAGVDDDVLDEPMRRIQQIAAGADTAAVRESLQRAAFTTPMAPPVRGGKVGRQMAMGDGEEPEGFTADVAAAIDYQRYIGPLRLCVDVVYPVWELYFDVPDITFRVTQDVDGDGTEEVIYSEGFSEIRWDSGPIGYVVLEAGPEALTPAVCNVPDDIDELVGPCEEPKIVLAGWMPLHNEPGANPSSPGSTGHYFDGATGYASRPNPPHTGGALSIAAQTYPAASPFCDWLQLRGCIGSEDAEYYRLLYSYNGGATVPFTGFSWKQFRWIGHLDKKVVAPDGNGWYEVLNPAEGWMDPYLLLNWGTPGMAHGLYEVSLQLANGSKTPIGSPTAPIPMRVDNSKPSVQNVVLSWSEPGTGRSGTLPATCPIIERSPGQHLEISVSFLTTAGHLRSLSVAGGGCGGAMTALGHSGDPLHAAGSSFGWWHAAHGDNARSSTATFRLPAGHQQGAYWVSFWVGSRAFNPAGKDAGIATDWLYNPVCRWRHPRWTFVVVDM